MRQYELGNWPKNVEPLLGMLLFAETWDEMLFDFTLDSFKPRRFNVLGLASEVIDTFNACEMGLLSTKSLTPIIDELCESLADDRTSKKILGTKLGLLNSELKQWNPDKPHKRVAYAASTLIDTVEPPLQVSLAEQLIMVAADAKRKADLIDISGRLLTELIRKGYSPSYIYNSVQGYFFRTHRINGFDDLASFLKIFDDQDKSYQVVFKANASTEQITRHAQEDFLKTARQLTPRCSPDPFDNEKNFLGTIGDDQVFLIAPKIESKDRYAARHVAEDRIATLSTMVGFLNHKARIGVGAETLVYEEGTPLRVFVIAAPVKPTMKRPDIPEDTLDTSLGEFIEPIVSSETESSTSNRLASALRAHLVGIEAEVTESQFSSLWTALEAITRTVAGPSAIGTVMRQAVPMLSLKYFLKLISELRSDIRRCIPSALDSVLSQRRPQESEMEFLVRLLSANECKPLRDQLYAACEKNPLLRYRISQYHDHLLCSPKVALGILKEHEKRIGWQLQRLYRARNIVIHVGFGNELIDLLVENLHDYFDHIFGEIVERLRSQTHYSTLEKVFFEYELDYQAYVKALQECPEQIEPHDAARVIVFGPNVPKK